MRTRCHNNFHLAQVLYTGRDLVIFDLEGDSTRPLIDRRRKRSPLRDVAGMLFSFRYAALAAVKRSVVRPEDVQTLAPWMRFWHHWACVTFMRAYLASAGESFLPKSREEMRMLLEFFLMKKAANSLYYDLRDHPERIEAPIQSLLRVLQTSDAGEV